MKTQLAGSLSGAIFVGFLVVVAAVSGFTVIALNQAHNIRIAEQNRALLTAHNESSHPPSIPVTLSILYMGSDGVLGVTRDIDLPFYPRRDTEFDMLRAPKSMNYSVTRGRLVLSFPDKKVKGKCREWVYLLSPAKEGEWKEVMVGLDKDKGKKDE